jgi:L-lactate dehydrogenase (cytochrome)
MNEYFNKNYPEIADLKRKTKSRIPKFAFDYLEGGCSEEIGVERNREDINSIQLRSELLKNFTKSNLSVELFGHSYSAPFGIAPVGLQGLMWPNSPEILAKAAAEKNIPYVLSTVSSSSLERIAEISEGKAWFQLYNPSDENIRSDLLNRISAAQYPVLVVTVDVPTFGYRPRDIKNGLAMPPNMTLNNILQMFTCPSWLIATALTGTPEMETLKPYMPANMKSDQFEEFLNKAVMGLVNLEGLKPIRDKWQGPLVIKGLINELDVKAAISLGADAVVISNHGARQLDNGESPIEPLQRISKKYNGEIKIFMDSGLRSGSNIASALACGADFTFLGRPFVYGVGALGNKGGIHTINALTMQLRQVMNQLGCACPADLPNHLVK